MRDVMVAPLLAALPPRVRRATRLVPPPPVLQRQALPRPDGRRARAAAAWRLVRALCALQPGLLRIVEAGGCTECYHLLVLCDARHPTSGPGDERPLAMLNVGGSLHVVARADGHPRRPADLGVDFCAVPWTMLCQADRSDEARRQRRHARELTARALGATLGLQNQGICLVAPTAMEEQRRRIRPSSGPS